MDRVELAKALRVAYFGSTPGAPWEEAGEGVREDYLREADKAIELLSTNVLKTLLAEIDALRDELAEIRFRMAGLEK